MAYQPLYTSFNDGDIEGVTFDNLITGMKEQGVKAAVSHNTRKIVNGAQYLRIPADRVASAQQRGMTGIIPDPDSPGDFLVDEQAQQKWAYEHGLGASTWGNIIKYGLPIVAGGVAMGMSPAAAGGASALPESYWSMTASGAPITDAVPFTMGAPEAATGAFDMAASTGTGLPMGTAGPGTVTQFTVGPGMTTAQAAGGGGMFDTFLTDLIKPSNLIPLAGQVIGAVNARGAAEDAAAAQIQGAGIATDEARRQFDLTRTDMAPWLNAGRDAIGTLATGTAPGGMFTRKFTMADMEADPVYQAGLKFGLDEGTKAIERRAAAAGGYDSGATLKALTRFGNDYGTTKGEGAYNRFTMDNTSLFNRLAAVSGIGQTAANTVATTGSNTANTVGQLAVGAGNARGASTIAGANAVTGAANNISNWFQNQQILNRLPMYTMG